MKPSNDREAITLILNGLAEKGWITYMVQDDTWNPDPEENTRVNTVAEAVDVVMGVDEAFVYLTRDLDTVNEGPDAYIYFVLGNEPEEVAADMTTNLSPDIDPIIDPWWS